jgi:hypothetical protein
MFCRIHECPSTGDIKQCIAFIQHEGAGDVVLTDDGLLINRTGYDLTMSASNTLPLSLLVSAYGSGHPPKGATRIGAWCRGVYYPSGQDWGDSPSGAKIDTFIKSLIAKRGAVFHKSFSSVKPQPREVANLLRHYAMLLRAQRYRGQTGGSDEDPLLFFDGEFRHTEKRQRQGQGQGGR